MGVPARTFTQTYYHLYGHNASPFLSKTVIFSGIFCIPLPGTTKGPCSSPQGPYFSQILSGERLLAHRVPSVAAVNSGGRGASGTQSDLAGFGIDRVYRCHAGIIVFEAAAVYRNGAAGGGIILVVQHIIRPIAGGGRLELTAVDGHRSPASTAHAGVDEDTGGPLAGTIEMAAVDGQPAIVARTNRRGHLVGVGLIRAVYRAGLALAAVIDSQVALLAADIKHAAVIRL